MGKASRQKPKLLGEKLRRIRFALGLSQSEILKPLGIDEEGYRNYISDFENDKREPPLPVLLRYARIANVWVDVLIDDELELPEKIPSARRHEGVKIN
ncbi:MAG TPA: helix-turn-helix transcriptional regulator [Pyrinomonadaceae bacterium]|nr:helix-turn-helix transcriptional regulator [Pyrinomonadaceae bacterium]